MEFYTGFQDSDTLTAFFEEVLQEDAEVMRQWRGAKSPDDYKEPKSGRKCKLSFLE